ncbi:MAG: SIMPL domain-containing protein [Pseudomonadota bacterium]
MFIRFLVALALAVPAVAMAQPAAQRAVTVEIIASGEINAVPSAYTLTASWSGQGDDEAAAKKAVADRTGQFLAVLQRLGVPQTAVTRTPSSTTETTAVVAALSDLPNKDGTKAALTVSDEDLDTKPSTMISEGGTIRVTTLEQATALRTALQEVEVDVTAAPEPVLDDRDGVRRQAKAKALSNARADAEAYARELGLRVIRVSKISEAGNGLFLPGLQDKMQQVFTSGPAGMRGLFEPKPGVVHIEASIIVEFILAP